MEEVRRVRKDRGPGWIEGRRRGAGRTEEARKGRGD